MRGRFTLIGVAVFLYLALSIVTVRTLRPWVDEGWAGAPAWSMVAHGYMGTPSLDADAFGPHGMKGIARYSYWEPPLYLAIQSLWYRGVPFSLEAVRALSVLSGLAGLAAWLFIMRYLTQDEWTAALFALLMSCDYIVITASAIGRSDAMSFAFQSLAYAAFLYLRERNFALAILISQSFVVASGLTHPNGGMLSLIGSVFLVWFFDRGRIRFKHVLLAGIPYAAGAAGWGAYILKDPDIFISQYSYQTAMRFHGLAHPMAALLREAERYVQVMGLGSHSPGSSGPHYLKALVFVCYAAAIIGILLTSSLRREKSVQVLLSLLGLYLLFYTLLEATKATYYLIYMISLYTALLAILIRWLWDRVVVPHAFVAALVTALLTVQAGGLFYRATTGTTT